MPPQPLETEDRPINDLITVYSAEILRRLQSRAFWLGLIFGLAGILLMMKLPQWLNAYAAQSVKIALAGDPRLVARARPLLAKDFPVSGTMGPLKSPPSRADLRARSVSSIIGLSTQSDGLHVVVYAQDPSFAQASDLRRDLLPLNLQLRTRLGSGQVQSLIQIPVTVRSVSEKFGTVDQANAARIIAYVLLVLLYILIIINSQLIMSSVAEEKTSRIAELLVAAVSPSSLLAGKVGASATLALVQMIVWVAAAYAFGMQAAPVPSHSGDDVSFSLNGISAGDVAGFGIFFILGFLQMATLFAALGSLINRTEDLGSVSGPLFIPVIAAFFIALWALEIPDTPAVIAFSFVPLIAPFVMFARIVVSSVPLWQVALSFAINAAAIWGIALLGGKIYRLGMLLYGRPPRFGQIVHLLRD